MRELLIKPNMWKNRLLWCIEILVVFVIVILALAGFFRKVRTTINQDFPMMIDLACYYVTAHALNAGLSPYNKESMDHIADQLGIDEYTDYIYPPFWGTLFRPLAYVSKKQIIALWIIINIVLYSVSVIILNSTFRIQKKYRYLSFLSLLLPPVYETILVGNINIFMLFLFSLALYFSISQTFKYSTIITSICIGISIGIKIYPIALLVPYLFYRKYPVIIYSLITMLMTVITGIVFGGSFNTTIYWFTSVVSSIPTKMVTYGDVSVYAVIYRLFNKGDYQAYDGYTLFNIHLEPIFNKNNIHLPLSFLLALAILITTLFYIYNLRRYYTENNFLSSFSITICLILLITPKVWDHYYTLIIIPLMFIISKIKLNHIFKCILLLIVLLLMLQRFIGKILILFPNHIMTFLPFFAGLLIWTLIIASIHHQKTLIEQKL
jgi:hypothetical protein